MRQLNGNNRSQLNGKMWKIKVEEEWWHLQGLNFNTSKQRHSELVWKRFIEVKNKILFLEEWWLKCIKRMDHIEFVVQNDYKS